MSPKITKPLDIYVRVSDVRGRSGDSFISPVDQETRCRALATARGYTVGEVFTDLDKSGGTMDRPAFNQALARIKDGMSGGIIVARMDRFSRTLKGAIETIEDIEQAGGYLIECEGEWDTSTPMGRFGRDLVIRLGQLYREQVADGWKGAKANAVAKGVHISPYAPPGYTRAPSKRAALNQGLVYHPDADRRFVPDGDHADTIREAYTMAVAGATPARIADMLNERGLTSRGRLTYWRSNRVTRLLANPVYKGEARSGNGHVNPEAHEALVDEATWQLAQGHRPAALGRATHLLSGLARCATCSYGMRPGGSIYRCQTDTASGRCPGPSSIAQTRIEEYVIAQFLERAAGYYEAHTVEGAEEAIHAATEAERAFQAALRNTDLRRQIGEENHDVMLAELHREWQEAKAQIPQSSPVPIKGGVTLAEHVERLRAEGRTVELRELLSAAIAAVFVRPAESRSNKLPVSDRVRVVFHGEEELVLPRRGERFEPRPYRW